MNHDDILLYLYKDVGLQWERTIGRPENRNRLSLNANRQLRAYVKGPNSRICYYLTNRNGIDEVANVPVNTFYLMEVSNQPRIGSLLCHIRNSIMHGNYKIIEKGDSVILDMKDFNRQRNVTMTGSISLGNLQELIRLVL